MVKEPAHDPEAEARHARYGRLPERIRFEDMTEEVEARPRGDTTGPDHPARSWTFYSCLVLDLGL
ncbi:hypothetical protein [Kitasatospora sp. NPDC090091]|uniref:hypothetical protein n=1 Tax=Kitasatospora sp. NPDC090091 TaxID=3364081 RepID=UPI003808F72E